MRRELWFCDTVVALKVWQARDCESNGVFGTLGAYFRNHGTSSMVTFRLILASRGVMCNWKNGTRLSIIWSR